VYANSAYAAPGERQGTVGACTGGSACFSWRRSSCPSPSWGGAACTFAADFRVLPGFSTTPSRGSFTTGGETGTADCVGMVFGQQILGAGTFGFEGEIPTAPPAG
jgi:hypothetical protein